MSYAYTQRPNITGRQRSPTHPDLRGTYSKALKAVGMFIISMNHYVSSSLANIARPCFGSAFLTATKICQFYNWRGRISIRDQDIIRIYIWQIGQQEAPVSKLFGEVHLTSVYTSTLSIHI